MFYCLNLAICNRAVFNRFSIDFLMQHTGATHPFLLRFALLCMILRAIWSDLGGEKLMLTCTGSANRVRIRMIFRVRMDENTVVSR